ncbi:Uncharacterised protein (plasmid) [Legionella adelaidensis]|uniref:Uncharacterized protein n=1 Tax=Legionella adelaidensis TaxID=45056 RepID=A0A0W0R477_9GAMM|nr:hypothetical protein [Legionella adelaidensis]KTC65872.1 hypothetical protein Lade_0530 [Legionella adelaidensis]VEH86185.1 Uncharacterised protein [Legionella adelaidensis]
MRNFFSSSDLKTIKNSLQLLKQDDLSIGESKIKTLTFLLTRAGNTLKHEGINPTGKVATYFLMADIYATLSNIFSRHDNVMKAEELVLQALQCIDRAAPFYEKIGDFSEGEVLDSEIPGAAAMDLGEDVNSMQGAAALNIEFIRSCNTFGIGYPDEARHCIKDFLGTLIEASNEQPLFTCPGENDNSDICKDSESPEGEDNEGSYRPRK